MINLKMTHTEAIESAGLGQGTEAGKPPQPAFASKRLARELHTIEAMIGCYCHAHHATTSALCPECRDLLDYATVRLQRCRFGPEKPVCAKCPVHCYLPARREQVKTVMRYAGPRMVWQHPILSLRHWLDGFSGGRASSRAL
jgi:Nitrous oxide-stimulated promoter